MASSSSTNCTQVPQVRHFDLVDSMQLQVVVFIFDMKVIIYELYWLIWKIELTLIHWFLQIMYLDLQMDAMLKLNFNIRTVQENGFFPGVALTMEISNVRMENLIIS